MSERTDRDIAAWVILASNLLAIAVAWVQDWALLTLLWPYFFQNLIIGGYSYRRLRALRSFSAEGLRINGQAVDATPETRKRVANFFLLHYGGFHVVYLIFLISFMATTATDAGVNAAASNQPAGPWILLLIAGFWLSHGFSHREHAAADLARKPNIGTLMFMPYLRVVPMHLTIIGFMSLGDGGGLLLFGGLKTLADVGMHRLEHGWLQQARTGSAKR